MTRSDDQMQGALPTQKLEWVTPKIALMKAEDTEGKSYTYSVEVPITPFYPWRNGPS